MSWLLNFGGPGWIQDVFEVNIVVDNPLRGSTDCLYIGVEDAPLYACDHAVSGVVEITAPLGHEVWCEGIEVTLEVGAMMYEELNSVDMASVSKELLLNGGRYIKGKCESLSAWILPNCLPSRVSMASCLRSAMS